MPKATNASSDAAQPLPRPWNIYTRGTRKNNALAHVSFGRVGTHLDDEEGHCGARAGSYDGLGGECGRDVGREGVDEVGVGAEVDSDHAEAERDSCRARNRQI